ncbi:hypothetical protein NBRC116583_28060 [Arenicella sp. 4NH20-0111]
MTKVITPDQIEKAFLGPRNGRRFNKMNNAGDQQITCIRAINPENEGIPKSVDTTDPNIIPAMNPPRTQRASGWFFANAMLPRKLMSMKPIHIITH